MAPRRGRRAAPLLLLLAALLAGTVCGKGLFGSSRGFARPGQGRSRANQRHSDRDGLKHLSADAKERRLLADVRAGPLPGLTFIPGFPGGGGTRPGSLSADDLARLRRIGVLDGGAGGAAAAGAAAAAGGAAAAGYVVNSNDPVAIALRQLSIAAIEAYGMEVGSAVDRAVTGIDNDLARYSDYLGRVADGLADGNVEGLLAAVQREIRVLVLVRAGLKNIGSRLDVYVKFLTAAASSWTAFVYAYTASLFRFQSLEIDLQSANDPFEFELTRVLYSLDDLTQLIALLLKPFIKTANNVQAFYDAFNSIVQAAVNDERNRFTVTPSIALDAPLGSGQNLQAVIDHIKSLADKLGTGENVDALLSAAETARDQVIAALRVPNPDGSSNVTGLFKQPGSGSGRAAGARFAQMTGLAEGASDASLFSATRG